MLGKANVPVSKILVLNEARKDLEKERKTQSKPQTEENMIPKIIHQVWMGGDIPAVRKQVQ